MSIDLMKNNNDSNAQLCLKTYSAITKYQISENNPVIHRDLSLPLQYFFHLAPELAIIQIEGRCTYHCLRNPISKMLACVSVCVICVRCKPVKVPPHMTREVTLPHMMKKDIVNFIVFCS
ncbi:hypothetical protein CEXT_718641 [Caerostris extrusa]|uniref:Uncharacterized protein n=1 Tax=Caerostris extrusa TaxID=172846 RepID=A0AAV4UTE6_CAEEX|nr:hypothetical protein CEXT_718641 [Caerostris extrusa]